MRLPRIFIPSASVHVFQRGHNKQSIFGDDRDYRTFLRLTRLASVRCGVDVHAFTLMTNHYHFIVTPRTAESLPRAIQDLAGKYTRYFNKRYGRSGTLWGGRYRGLPIENDHYWFACLRYVEANPVEAGVVPHPENYPWSSYRFHALGASVRWLVPHPLYLSLGTTPDNRQRAYRAHWQTDAVSDTDGV